MAESRVPVSNNWIRGGGAVILVIIAIPLWNEFRLPGNTVWNVILAAMLLALVIAALLLQHFFVTHVGEVGEARFDTNNGERDR